MPFGHLAVDCIMLAIWLWHAHSLYQRKTDYLPSRIEPVMFFQEGGSVTFLPRFIDPPGRVSPARIGHVAGDAHIGRGETGSPHTDSREAVGPRLVLHT